MTTVTDRPPRTAAASEQIVFIARVGSQRVSLTAAQVLDTIAAYLARGQHMPTPDQIRDGDPYAPLHVITEEWLWGNVEGWAAQADRVQLVDRHAQALAWARDYFGSSFPDPRG